MAEKSHLETEEFVTTAHIVEGSVNRYMRGPHLVAHT